MKPSGSCGHDPAEWCDAANRLSQPGSGLRHNGEDLGTLRLCPTTQNALGLDSAIARLADAFDTVAPHADRQCQSTAT